MVKKSEQKLHFDDVGTSLVAELSQTAELLADTALNIMASAPPVAAENAKLSMMQTADAVAPAAASVAGSSRGMVDLLGE